MNHKNNDLVSIVIPVYNGEKYIFSCVDSLIKQSYSKIEIIVVDDGSKDSTVEIVGKMQKNDKRLVLVSQKNSGVSSARNLGIKKAKGKYITFVDSDDTVQVNYIEYLYSLIINYNADVALTRKPLKFNSSMNVENSVIVSDKVEKFSGSDAANEMLLYKIVISAWNKMFSKELLIKNNVYFNKNLSFGEGFEFVINTFLNSNKVVIGNAKIYNYRVDNENSVMTKFSRKLVTGSIEAQNSIYELIDNSNLKIEEKEKLKQAWKYSNWHTNCDCFNTIVGCNVKNSNEDLYKLTKKGCKSLALNSLKYNISIKDKIKSISYFIFPSLTSNLINKFRLRKYTKEK